MLLWVFVMPRSLKEKMNDPNTIYHYPGDKWAKPYRMLCGLLGSEMRELEQLLTCEWRKINCPTCSRHRAMVELRNFKI